MPRANRFMQPGELYHLTHRCHDRQFLLGTARDRSEYRERLRQASKECGVTLLNYCLPSSHTHELAVESKERGISRMIQKADGGFGISYNKRKERSGAVWEDRFGCTMIESGEHLWNCVIYIDLNMYRAGVVRHPSEWEWCGYHELVGERSRYCLLDLDRLMGLLGMRNIKDFRCEYQRRIENAIAGNRLKREKCWTEAIAVGSREFVGKIAKNIRYGRVKPDIEEMEDGAWVIWDPPAKYLPCSTNPAPARILK